MVSVRVVRGAFCVCGPSIVFLMAREEERGGGRAADFWGGG